MQTAFRERFFVKDNFSSRRITITAIFIVVGLIYIIRLAHLQIIDDSYTRLANRNALRHITQYPSRGLIYDRNGRLLNVLTGEIIRDARQIELGSVYEGIVTGIKPYGVFVKIYDVHNGMIHKSILNKYEIDRLELKKIIIQIIYL